MKRLFYVTVLILAGAAAGRAGRVDLTARARRLAVERFQPVVCTVNLLDEGGVQTGRTCAVPVSEGIVAVCRHEILAAHSVTLMTPDGLVYRFAGAVHDDPFADLLYLAVEAPPDDLKPLRRDPRSGRAGETVFIVAPQGARPVTATMKVTGVRPVPLSDDVYVLEGPPSEDSNGCPAVTCGGVFLGLAVAAETGHNFVCAAVPPGFPEDAAVRKPLSFPKWREGVSAAAQAHFRRGITAVWAGDYAQAGRHFARAAAADPNDAEYAYCRGWAAHAAGDFESAIGPLSAALEVNPLWDEAHMLLASCCTALGRFDDARTHFSESLLSSPGDKHVYLALGKRFDDAGFHTEAVKCYRKALTQAGEDAVIWQHLGRALVNQGTYEAALSAFQKACALDDGLFSVRLDLGRCMLETGRAAAALDVFLELVRLTPGNPRAVEGLADTYRMLGRYEAAALAYRRALKIEQTSAALRRKLGRLQMRMERPEEAALSFRAAVLQEPSDAGSRYLYGTACHQAHHFEEAVKARKKACELEPGNAVYLCALGDSLRAVKKYDEAAAAFRKAIHRDPGAVCPVLGLAGVMRETGAYADALEALRQAEALDPLEPLVHNERALLHRDAGRYAQAVAAFRSAVELDPLLFDAWYEMGRALVRLGQDRRAAQAFEHAGRLRHDHAPTFRRLAACLVRQERYVETIDACNHGLLLDPECAEMFLFRGKAYYHLDNKRDALASLLNAIRLDGELGEARYLAARIYLRSGNRDGARAQYRALCKMNDPWADELSFAFGSRREP